MEIMNTAATTQQTNKQPAEHPANILGGGAAKSGSVTAKQELIGLLVPRVTRSCEYGCT